MNKVDSLAFLDECLKKLDYASQEDISRYNEVYKENCTGDLEEGSFEFCVPKPNLSDSFVIEKDYSTCKIIYEKYSEKPKIPMKPVKEVQCNTVCAGLEYAA